MVEADQSGSGVATTCDAFLAGRVMVDQPKTGYRAGLDAVLLAATVPVATSVQPQVKVLDLGSGVGTVGLCVAARVATAIVVLLEREPALLALAADNVARNGMSARVRVVAADVDLAAEMLGLASDSFDHVLANPPYQIEGQGRPSNDPVKARSHAMPAGNLDRWARVMARVTKPGGTATLIHRADAVGEILSTFEGRFGAIVVLPIYPRSGEHAVRIVVSGIKGNRAPLRVMPGLVLHKRDGHEFTPQLQAILRDGSVLPLT